MLQWLKQERCRGIMFSSEGNKVPVAFSDASNVIDPADCLVQAGYNIQLAGGPIMYSSQKLKHIAPTGATSHVEYMGISQCCQAVVWLRQLLQEIQLYDMIDDPTVVYGDNAAANKLCKENIVSAGNRYFYLSYHWVKELQDDGVGDVKGVKTKFNLSAVFIKAVGTGVIRELFGCMLGYKDFRTLDLSVTENAEAT